MNDIQQFRAEIERLETRMLAMPQQDGMITSELRLGDIYVRHLFIPAGTLLTGMIHKTECINILASGVIQVWTEDEGLHSMKGYCMFPSDAGTKRIGKTWTDVNWVNIFPLDESATAADLTELVATMNYDDPEIKRLN